MTNTVCDPATRVTKSLLANGDLGWIQIANLVLTGLPGWANLSRATAAVLLAWTWLPDFRSPLRQVTRRRTMRYLALLKAARPNTPPPELMEAIMKLGEEATNSGALIDNGAWSGRRGS